jgi:uncharacterized protein involved in type VI secretion and phage assembly
MQQVMREDNQAYERAGREALEQRQEQQPQAIGEGQQPETIRPVLV